MNGIPVYNWYDDGTAGLSIFFNSLREITESYCEKLYESDFELESVESLEDIKSFHLFDKPVKRKSYDLEKSIQEELDPEENRKTLKELLVPEEKSKIEFEKGMEVRIEDDTAGAVLIYCSEAQTDLVEMGEDKVEARWVVEVQFFDAGDFYVMNSWYGSPETFLEERN